MASVPPSNDDTTAVSACTSKQQQNLDQFFSPTALVAAVPAAVTIVSPDPLADGDQIVVTPPSPKQRRTLRNFWSYTYNFFLFDFPLFPTLSTSFLPSGY